MIVDNFYCCRQFILRLYVNFEQFGDNMCQRFFSIWLCRLNLFENDKNKRNTIEQNNMKNKILTKKGPLYNSKLTNCITIQDVSRKQGYLTEGV